jgi:hypothetical protein
MIRLVLSFLFGFLCYEGFKLSLVLLNTPNDLAVFAGATLIVVLLFTMFCFLKKVSR